MATFALPTTALPEIVRKPRVHREVKDSVSVLYKKLAAQLALLRDDVLAASYEKDAQFVLLSKDGDNQANRLTMLHYYLEAREEVRRQTEKDAEFARFQIARKTELDAWHACKDAWIAWVHNDPANVANRQLAMNLAFYVLFEQAEERIHRLWVAGPDFADETLLVDFTKLASKVEGHVQKFCTGCHKTIPDSITVKGKTFNIDQCSECHNSPAAAKPGKYNKAEVELTEEQILEIKAQARRDNAANRDKNKKTNEVKKAERKSKKVLADGQGGKKTKKTSNKNAPGVAVEDGEKVPAKAVTKTKKAKKAE